jgi:hypothetical protein
MSLMKVFGGHVDQRQVEHIMAQVEQLDETTIRAIDRRIHEWLQKMMNWDDVPTKREVVKESRQQLGTWAVQLEFVKCGKPRCKKDRHGPYWYGYRKEGGKLKSIYIGKDLANLAKKDQANIHTTGDPE